MSFASKTEDWRKWPVEVREALYYQLQQRKKANAQGRISRVELAHAVGIVPDQWQQDILESEENQIILNCTRQFGKSSISAILGLYQTCYVEKSLTLILAPSSRQSSETYRKVRDFY